MRLRLGIPVVLILAACLVGWQIGKLTRPHAEHAGKVHSHPAPTRAVVVHGFNAGGAIPGLRPLPETAAAAPESETTSSSESPTIIEPTPTESSSGGSAGGGGGGFGPVTGGASE